MSANTVPGLGRGVTRTDDMVQRHTLLESPANGLHLPKLLNGVARQRNKAGLVPFLEWPDPMFGKHRSRRVLTPHLEQREVVEDMEHLQLHDFNQGRVG